MTNNTMTSENKFKGYAIQAATTKGKPYAITAWFAGGVDGPYFCDLDSLRTIVPKLRKRGHVRTFWSGDAAALRRSVSY